MGNTHMDMGKVGSVQVQDYDVDEDTERGDHVEKVDEPLEHEAYGLDPYQHH